MPAATTRRVIAFGVDAYAAKRLSLIESLAGGRVDRVDGDLPGDGAPIRSSPRRLFFLGDIMDLSRPVHAPTQRPTHVNTDPYSSPSPFPSNQAERGGPAPPGTESAPPPPAWWRKTDGNASTSGTIPWLAAPLYAIPETTKLLMCGGVAGAFSKTCTAPLARITILRQLQSTGAVAGWAGTAKVGIVPALGKIIREEGVRALWKGNMVTVIQRLPYSSINFYLYENIMDFLEGEGAFVQKDGDKKQSGDKNTRAGREGQKGLGWDVARRLVAGGSAGMIACTCTYPLDLVRTRLAAQTTVKHYDGLLHALWVIGSKEGPRGLYRGLAPTLAQIGPNLAINFAAYETLSKLAKEHELGERMPPAMVSLACGSTSAVVSATATYPLDLVRRRLQMRCAQDRGHGFVRVFKDVFKAEGLSGFYRGIIPEYAKVVPGVSITYMTYELLKRSIGVDTGRL